MPRYFFDLDIGPRVIRDGRGTDLPEDEAAREAAVAVVPDIVRIMNLTGEAGQLTSIVRDAAGRVIFSLTMTLRYD